MKIIGGKYKGRNFYMPAGISPTQNIVRKAVFDILGHDLSGLNFLDLFAGSGAVGLEAISRGADRTVFVEKDTRCSEIIGDNIAVLGIMRELEEKRSLYELVNADGFASIKMFFRQNVKFDVVFADPPYGRGLAKKTLKTLCSYDILHPNSLLFIQHEIKECLPDFQGRFILFRRKRYGMSMLSLYNISNKSDMCLEEVN